MRSHCIRQRATSRSCTVYESLGVCAKVSCRLEVYIPFINLDTTCRAVLVSYDHGDQESPLALHFF